MYSSIIAINKKAEMPVYLQIANSIINKIQEGTIKPGSKMPSSRELAAMLVLNHHNVAALQQLLLLQNHHGAFELQLFAQHLDHKSIMLYS